MLLGRISLLQNNNHEAEGHFWKAHELNHGSELPLLAARRISESPKTRFKADQKLIELHTKQGYVYLSAANYKIESDDFEKAVDYLHKLYSLRLDNTECFNEADKLVNRLIIKVLSEGNGAVALK